MMLRVGWRSLMTRPIRAAVLAAGFGFGIAVMAALLGVGQVILEQAHAPALVGGGDLVVSGPFGSVPSARFVMSSVRIGAGCRRPRDRRCRRRRDARLYLMTPQKAIPITRDRRRPEPRESGRRPGSVRHRRVDGRAGRRAMGACPTRSDVLRAMDRFHPIPDVAHVSRRRGPSGSTSTAARVMAASAST